MSNYPDGHRSPPHGSAVKLCPWCGGGLSFEPNYPLTNLVPGASRTFRDENVPPALLTVAAWVCATPHCRYREKA